MSLSLADPYQFDEASQIWSRTNYAGIAYNDGDEVEQRLLKIVSAAADLTVLSGELKSHCTDWPSLYHLSSSRANILRPFEGSLQDKKVLEIGAGCGAITRYMGECGAQVLALEGSPRRAATARARTRNLDNVAVLAERFSDFESTEKFDIVTLIGVLEYASLFVDEEQADLAMLSRAKNLLAPDGKLIIAIENQLGLKYFAGALEDHVSQASFGLEDRYVNGGVRTYGRQALQEKLIQSGFASTRFFAPFPDYKLPVTIISEEGFDNPDMDTGHLIAQSVRRDPQLPNLLAFNPERVWPVLHQNKIALDLSNSFLIEAQQHAQPAVEQEIDLGWHFSTDRREEFCKTTIFTELAKGEIQVSRLRSKKNSPAKISQKDLTNTLEQPEKLSAGVLVSIPILEAITREGWSDDLLKSALSDYLSALRSTVGIHLDLNTLATTMLSGEHIDAIPQNIIKTADGTYHLFDQEWNWDRSISAAFLLFRGFLAICGSATRLGRNQRRHTKNRYEFIILCFEALGSPITNEQMDEYCRLEAELQKLVGYSGTQSDHVIKSLQHWASDPGNAWTTLDQLRSEKASLIEKNSRLEASVHSIREELANNSTIYNQKIEAANQLATERLEAIENLQSIIQNRDATIQSITQSRSWLITKPLRFLTKSLATAQRNGATTLTDLVDTITLKIQIITGKPKRICACIHAFYPEALVSMLERLKDSKIPVRLLITTTHDKKDAVASIASKYSLDHKIIIVENKGRDILPFLIAVKETTDDDLIVKLHTKRSLHRLDGDIWREDMIAKLLDPVESEKIFHAFRSHPLLGMVVPKGHVLSVDEYIGNNHAQVNEISSRLITRENRLENRVFSGGAMFFVRKAALAPLLDIHLEPDDFEPELGQIDGTLAHALERVLGLCVGHSGQIISSTENLGEAAQPNANLIHTNPKVKP